MGHGRAWLGSVLRLHTALPGVQGLSAGCFFSPREEDVVAALKSVLRNNWFKEGRDKASLCLKGFVAYLSRGGFGKASAGHDPAPGLLSKANVTLGLQKGEALFSELPVSLSGTVKDNHSALCCKWKETTHLVPGLL